MSNTKPSKRFEEWEEVDCNQCERYWLNQCDASKTSQNGSKTPCNSFLPTRSVKIPLEIKSLKKAIFWLSIWCIILAILIFLVLLLVIAV